MAITNGLLIYTTDSGSSTLTPIPGNINYTIGFEAGAYIRANEINGAIRGPQILSYIFLDIIKDSYANNFTFTATMNSTNIASAKTVVKTALDNYISSKNVASANKLNTARTFQITSSGTAVSFDGTGNITLQMPASITSNTSGKAATAGRADEVVVNSSNTTDTYYIAGMLDNEVYTSTNIYFKNGELTAQTFNTSSDKRLKKNIVDYNYTKSILDIPVKEFDYIETGVHTIGFIAQDLEKLFPELVVENEQGYKAIAENKLVYLLLEEVKKLRKELDELKEK